MHDPTDSGRPSNKLVAAVAAAIAASPPPDDGRRAVPRATWVPHLRRAGWPVQTVTLYLPQTEHRGPRAGQRTADAPQPVSAVPLAWLADLARRVKVDWAYACRAVVADD
jgi:hypothetical protein